MSRRSRRRRINRMIVPQREALRFTTRRRVLRPVKLFAAPLRLYEDRRVFHPRGRQRAAFSEPRLAARVVVSPVRSRRLPAALSFTDPRRVVVCVRRRIRRQVLFANGTGGARGRKRQPRRNEFSSIRC